MAKPKKKAAKKAAPKKAKKAAPKKAAAKKASPKKAAPKSAPKLNVVKDEASALSSFMTGIAAGAATTSFASFEHGLGDNEE